MMSLNQIANLEKKLVYQAGVIFNLKEKLRSYNNDMIKKDTLQKNFDELKRIIEETEINHKQTTDGYLKIIERQQKHLQEFELTIIPFCTENHRLKNASEDRKKQLKTLQRNERTYIADIEKLETSNKNLKNNLCNVKNQLCEKSRTVEKLTKELESKEEVIECMRNDAADEKCKRNTLETGVACFKAKLNECQATERRLLVRCRELEAAVECARAKLEDAESRATAAKALECRVQKQREPEAECEGRLENERDRARDDGARQLLEREKSRETAEAAQLELASAGCATRSV